MTNLIPYREIEEIGRGRQDRRVPSREHDHRHRGRCEATDAPDLRVRWVPDAA